MLKIEQNWGKIANCLPLCSTKICTANYRYEHERRKAKNRKLTRSWHNFFTKILSNHNISLLMIMNLNAFTWLCKSSLIMDFVSFKISFIINKVVRIKFTLFNQINQIFYFTRCITPKRVTSLRAALLRPGNTAPFEKMQQRWRTVGTTMTDSTGPRFKL